jgi:hypothetical protein
MRQFALIVSAVLFGLTANAAADPAPSAEVVRVVQVRFDGFCDGLEIRVTGNYAAALPTGCAAGDGVAVGAIGRPPTGSGKVLALGQNLNGIPNTAAMFLLTYPLANGGTVALIGTTNGKTVQNGGSSTYFLGRPRSTRGSKSFLSQLQQAE